MIQIKRLTQPPRPSWCVWDTVLPASTVIVTMTEAQWAVLNNDPRHIRVAVAARLAEAAIELLDKNTALQEL
jgi:hypothetical protein